MQHLMEGLPETMSIYHCIRIAYDPRKSDEDDHLQVCDTRIDIFTSPSGDHHSFKHRLGGEKNPVVWTAGPGWTQSDISEYYADQADQNLLEPDDALIDVFYVICRDRPTTTGRSHEIGKNTFMNHVEDMVKTSVASARIVQDSSVARNYMRKGKGKGSLFSKKHHSSPEGHSGLEETTKKHLVDVVLPYICHLCKNPLKDTEDYDTPRTRDSPTASRIPQWYTCRRRPMSNNNTPLRVPVSEISDDSGKRNVSPGHRPRKFLQNT